MIKKQIKFVIIFKYKNIINDIFDKYLRVGLMAIKSPY